MRMCRKRHILMRLEKFQFLKSKWIPKDLRVEELHGDAVDTIAVVVVDIVA